MAFWTFGQNNSGGHFDFDGARGITHHVIVEAASKEEAVQRALDIGIYFNGCSNGRDCECCGDRWYEPWDDKGSEFPEVYGQNVRERGEDRGMQWMPEGKEICIHPLSGPLEWLGA